MKIHLIPLCGAIALLAACDPKPSHPPLPNPTPTMHTTVAPLPTPSPIMDVMPTPGPTVSPMPTASPLTTPGQPEMGAGPMATPAASDKALIVPPTTLPGGSLGSGRQGPDPSIR